MLNSQQSAVKPDGNYTYRQRRWYSDLGHETTVVSFVRDGCGIGEAIRLRRRVFHAVYRTGRGLGIVWSLAGAKLASIHGQGSDREDRGKRT